MAAIRTKKMRNASIQRQESAQEATQRDAVPAVGSVLRRAREHRGLALREVERRTGRSSAYLSQVERGLIRQPDPVVLLELADLYRLDFMTLARWAGWTDQSGDVSESGNSGTILVRRVLELNEAQRAEIFSYVEKLLRERRT